VFPGAAIALQPLFREKGLLFVAFVLSVLQIPFVLICFPRPMPGLQVALSDANPLDASSTRSSTGAANPLVLTHACGDICKALRWIFRKRLAATVVWISIALVGAADSSNLMLFLGKGGLGWAPAQVNVVMGSIGFFGVVISLGLVPCMSKFVSKGFLVFISTWCTVGHCLVYGLFTSVLALTGLGFLGSLTYAAVPTLLAYMDKENDSGLPQGVLVGAFCGLKSFAVIMGPPVLAGCLQAFKDGEPICYFIPGKNSAGTGFIVMAICMGPACLASVRLLLQGRREKALHPSAAQ